MNSKTIWQGPSATEPVNIQQDLQVRGWVGESGEGHELITCPDRVTGSDMTGMNDAAWKEDQMKRKS